MASSLFQEVLNALILFQYQEVTLFISRCRKGGCLLVAAVLFALSPWRKTVFLYIRTAVDPGFHFWAGAYYDLVAINLINGLTCIRIGAISWTQFQICHILVWQCSTRALWDHVTDTNLRKTHEELVRAQRNNGFFKVEFNCLSTI